MNNINGKIIKINKDLYTIKTNNSILSCSVRGKLRNEKLVVGDNVLISENNNTIEELLPRKNVLVRPLISNIDKLIIVVSTQIPAFSEYLLDKLLVICELNNIEPIICVTKLDLLVFKEKNRIRKVLKYYKKIGYTVIENNRVSKIKKEIKNKTVCLTGQTGSGKSTLLNKIDKNLKLKTDEVSVSLGRGKHTTRIVELIETNNCLIADTPGFSALELKITKEQLKKCFVEFESCKYRSCLHQFEDGCKVIEQLKQNKILKTRYANYIKMLGECTK